LIPVKRKKLMNKQTFIFFVSVIPLLTTCGVLDFSTATSSDVLEQKCIPAVSTFAYPTNRKIDTVSTLGENQILPLAPWRLETELPNLPEGTNSYSFTVLARQDNSTNKLNEVWVRRNWWFVGEKAGEPGGSQILVYQPKTREWREVPSRIPGTEGNVSEIFQAKNGTIWADGYFAEHHFIGIYDDEENLFGLAKGSENIPNGHLFLDESGKFWIVKSQAGIYSFDPITTELKMRISIPDLILPSGSELMPVAFASDGSMYILNEAGKDGSELLRFFINTGEIERNVPVSLEYTWPIYSLFMDNLDRLWVHDLGWKDSDNVWHQIIRSPVFLINRKSDSGLNFTWPYAYIILESSDGTLWFRSENGMTSLNPQLGEWCWFTTYQSNIVEDSDRNLWMIADGKLYKLALNP
jgi:streptogramin lyase